MRSFYVQSRPEPEPPIRFDARHVHDFEVAFDDGYPMEYQLRCACGERATDMKDAVRLTNLSRNSADPDVKKILSHLFLAAAVIFFVWVIGRGIFW